MVSVQASLRRIHIALHDAYPIKRRYAHIRVAVSDLEPEAKE